MPTDILSQIRNAERDAEARIAAARKQARCLEEETEQEVRELLARAESDARAEADALKRHRLALAQEEAEALRRQADAEASRLRDLLAQRLDNAAARIVAYILPNRADARSPRAHR